MLLARPLVLSCMHDTIGKADDQCLLRAIFCSIVHTFKEVETDGFTCRRLKYVSI